MTQVRAGVSETVLLTAYRPALVFDVATEQRFHPVFVGEQIAYLRVASPIAAACFLIYLLWDWNADPSQIQSFVALRFLACALLGALHVSTYWSGFTKFGSLVTAVVVATSGFTMTTIIALRPAGFTEGVEGLLQVMLFAGAACRMSTWATAGSFAAILIAANLMMMQGGLPGRYFLDNNMHLLAGASFGLVFADLSNWRSRQAFALNSQLGSALTEARTQRAQRAQWLEGLAGFLRHELKNQLVAISSSITLLERATGKRGAVFIERAQRSVLMIQRLVQSASEASTIEAALALEQRRDVPMTDLVDERVATFRASTERLVTFRSDGSMGWVLGSDVRLIQMLDKLLSNAVDHSPPGTPIEVELRTLSGHVEIRVMNDGTLPLDSSTLFVPFYSGQNRPTEHQGLGLFVAQAIVVAHAGSIEARSEAGRVQFTIHFPETQPAPKALAKAKLHDSS